VEFNTKYLSRFSAAEVAGTIIHEMMMISIIGSWRLRAAT
jgi:hypothetical protein